jgi:murein DD-endopeptidase MepM/ murein hydrolase activator NlpD
MIGLLRIAGVCVAVASVWIVGASHVASSEKLALTSIVPGASMTQPFGCSNLVLEPFDPYCPSHHIHTGVDLAAPQGTAVRAAAGGIASVAYDPAGAGLFVAVASGGHTRVLYCHLSLASVKDGDPVVTGQIVGEVGASGLATGPHLHFEVQVDSRAIDPVVWLAS